MDSPETPRPTKGRGAVTNASGRYECEQREAVDDGWDLIDPDLPPLRTQVTLERPKTIIARNRSPDVPFDRSINPYKGCEHGCVYCFARPTHAYMGLSPGLDFESKLFAKPDAAKLLERELSTPGYEPRPIQLGSNTDPYQPVEKSHEITRRVLQVLSRFNHPLAITTKSALVCRDIDILAPMAEKGLVAVALSVCTLDGKLARALEPRAPRPDKRFQTMRALSDSGIPVAVMVAPMIPVLNDSELETIMERAAGAGAGGAGYIMLRLPRELKDLFSEWLEAHAPGQAKHVLNQVRETRAGSLNSAQFGTRMRGTGERAELLAQRFRAACRRFGLKPARAAEFRLDGSRFSPPPRVGDQMTLL